MLPADHLPHTADPNTDGHDLGNAGVTERDRMTDLMNSIAPAHLVREFQLTGQQGFLKIVPSKRPLLPSGVSSGITHKPLNVGSSAAGRQQGQPSKVGTLVWCGSASRTSCAVSSTATSTFFFAFPSTASPETWNTALVF